jgi:hypothetical protein
MVHHLLADKVEMGRYQLLLELAYRMLVEAVRRQVIPIPQELVEHTQQRVAWKAVLEMVVRVVEVMELPIKAAVPVEEPHPPVVLAVLVL